MELSNSHNLRSMPPEPADLKFGVRVTMSASDPLRSLLGSTWQKEHWFASRAERDEAIETMGMRHAYSRSGDTPSIRLAPIDR